VALNRGALAHSVVIDGLLPTSCGVLTSREGMAGMALKQRGLAMTAIDASAAQDGETVSVRQLETLGAGLSTVASQSPLSDEYETAIKQRVVSFEQVVQAAFGRRSSQAASSDQAVHAQYYPRLLQSFAEVHRCPSRPHHSGILHYYFADHIDAAVIMTADDELYVQFKPTGSDQVGFIDLLIRMTGVHIKARHVLQRERRLPHHHGDRLCGDLLLHVEP
jgi:hypothetical protein